MKELVKELNLKVGDIYKNFKTLKSYRVVEIKEEEGKVKLEGLETRNLTTTLKALSTNYYLVEEEVKEEEVKEASISKEEVEEEVKEEEEEVKEENKKTLVEEALEEAGLSSKLGKIGDKVEEEDLETLVKGALKEIMGKEEEASIEEEVKEEEIKEEEVKEETKEESKEASIEEVEEEAKDPIEDSIITLEDLSRGDKVTIVTKDLKVYKGEVTFLGELTIKIIDTKEFNILKVDLLYIFKDNIDLGDLTRFIKDKGIRPEETKKDKKPNKDTKKVTKKDKEEGIITLRDIIEEIVREKLLILDLEYNPNNTFKNIRKKIRKRGEVTKKLRLEGYTYSFRIENKNLIKEELLKILA